MSNVRYLSDESLQLRRDMVKQLVEAARREYDQHMFEFGQVEGEIYRRFRLAVDVHKRPPPEGQEK